MASESTFQKNLKKELKERFPGCIIYKTDCQQLQGSPDLLILHKDHWAGLEVKRDAEAARRSKEKQPGQRRCVERMNNMSYASYIFPENKESVLNDLERLFEA